MNRAGSSLPSIGNRSKKSKAKKKPPATTKRSTGRLTGCSESSGKDYDAVFVLESRFARELFAYIRNFQEKANINVSAAGFEMCIMDTSHISVLRVCVRAEGCLYSEWRSERDNYVVGLEIDSWKRSLQSTAERGMAARISFGAKVDLSRIEVGYWEPELGLRVMNDLKVRNIVITTEALDLPVHEPWLSVLMNSAVLRREITKHAKVKPDDLIFRIRGREVNEALLVPPEKKPKREFSEMSEEEAFSEFMQEWNKEPPSPPPSTKMRLMPEELLFTCQSDLVDWTTHFPLVDDRDVKAVRHDDTPAWKSGARIESQQIERDEEKELQQAIVFGIDDVADEEGEDDDEEEDQPSGIEKKRKLHSMEVAEHRLTMQCGIVTKIGPQEPVHEETGKRKTDFYFSPKVLNNISAGASFANHVTLEFFPENVIHVVYDLGKLGSIESYLAGRVDNND